jgi:hypothetical protein
MAHHWLPRSFLLFCHHCLLPLPVPFPHHQATTGSLSVTTDCVFVWLLSQHSDPEMGPRDCVPFHCWGVSHCPNGPPLVYLTTEERLDVSILWLLEIKTLGKFACGHSYPRDDPLSVYWKCILSLRNSALLSLKKIHFVWSTLPFLLGRGTDESRGRCDKSCQMAVQSCHTTLHSHQMYRKAPIGLYFCQPGVLGDRRPHCSHSKRRVSHRSVSSSLTMRRLSVCQTNRELLAICFSYLENCILKSFANF